MAYTVAVVDEGLLDLTNFNTPQPWNSFYSKEALGVKSWDIYDDVIGALTNNFGPLLAIGGGGEIEPPKAQKASRFKPVVKFFLPFNGDENWLRCRPSSFLHWTEEECPERKNHAI